MRVNGSIVGQDLAAILHDRGGIEATTRGR